MGHDFSLRSLISSDTSFFVVGYGGADIGDGRGRHAKFIRCDVGRETASDTGSDGLSRFGSEASGSSCLYGS